MSQRLDLLKLLLALFKLIARLKLQRETLSNANAGEYSGTCIPGARNTHRLMPQALKFGRTDALHVFEP